MNEYIKGIIDNVADREKEIKERNEKIQQAKEISQKQNTVITDDERKSELEILMNRPYESRASNNKFHVPPANIQSNNNQSSHVELNNRKPRVNFDNLNPTSESNSISNNTRTNFNSSNNLQNNSSQNITPNKMVYGNKNNLTSQHNTSNNSSVNYSSNNTPNILNNNSNGNNLANNQINNSSQNINNMNLNNSNVNPTNPSNNLNEMGAIRNNNYTPNQAQPANVDSKSYAYISSMGSEPSPNLNGSKIVEVNNHNSEFYSDFNFDSYIRRVPNFPKDGITFHDITTLIKDKFAFRKVIETLAARYKHKKIDLVVGPESRGFIFGAPLAYELGAGFVVARKPGKLPATAVRAEYTLEYGKDMIEIHKDAISKGQTVLIIDDLIATGGTINAVCSLVEHLGGEIVDCAFVVDLVNLHPNFSRPYFSLLKYQE